MKNLAYLLPLLVLTSCEKAFLPAEPSTAPDEVLKVLTTEVRNRYSYVQVKNINLDLLEAQAQAQITPGITETELFDVLANYLYQLEDGHVNLIAPFDISRNWEWYLNSPDNFNADLVEREYLGANYRIAGNIRYTMLPDSVGYLYVPAFTSSVGTAQLEAIFSRLQHAKGLIVDVRHNGGGSLSVAYALANRLVSESKPAYSQWVKSGPAPTDFELEGTYQNSPSSGTRFTGPVVVLTNRRSYSASTFFAALVQPYDHITLMGDTTGGGGGLPMYGELPNGWTYRLSVTRAVGTDGREMELGVLPDTAFHLNTALYNQDLDEYIEVARARF